MPSAKQASNNDLLPRTLRKDRPVPRPTNDHLLQSDRKKFQAYTGQICPQNVRYNERSKLLLRRMSRATSEDRRRTTPCPVTPKKDLLLSCSSLHVAKASSRRNKYAKEGRRLRFQPLSRTARQRRKYQGCLCQPTRRPGKARLHQGQV